MAPPVALTILLAYASLAVELTVLHVASVASSRSIWFPDPALVRDYSPRYRRVFELPRSAKALLFVAPLLAAYGIYLLPLLAMAYGPDPLRDYVFAPTAVTNGAAIGGMVLGRAIALAAALTIRRDNEQRDASFRLHTAGPFRFCRNPGLLGMYVLAFSLWLAVPSTAMLVGITIYIGHMHFKVLMEEDFLGNKFGSAYHRYCGTTGRYWP